MRSGASPGSASCTTWSSDDGPAAARRDRLRRPRSALRGARARHGAPGDALLALRVRPRRPLLRLPGARRRAVCAGRLFDRLPARPRGCDRARRREAEEARGMSRGRLALFGAGAVVLGFLLVNGLVDLPPFGHYAGPYGDIITKHTEPQRHIANAVTAVVFDYRGFDTMGEELILFLAASAVALILRETRDHQTKGVVDAVRSDALAGLGVLASIATLLVALYVVSHGLVTPGGGFQGGVIIATAFVLVFLAIEYHAYARIAPSAFAEPLDAFGVGSYIGVGLISFAFGLSFLENFLDLGVTGRLRSGGSAALVNWSSALAVAGSFLLIFAEYLEENMAQRYRRAEP